MTGAVLAFTLLLAAANGSNDDPKGVATLGGAGVTGYRNALAWGVVTTLAGSVVSVPLAAGLTQLFSNGIVTAHRVGEPRRSCARWPRRDPGLAHVAHPRLDRGHRRHRRYTAIASQPPHAPRLRSRLDGDAGRRRRRGRLGVPGCALSRPR